MKRYLIAFGALAAMGGSALAGPVLPSAPAVGLGLASNAGPAVSGVGAGPATPQGMATAVGYSRGAVPRKACFVNLGQVTGGRTGVAYNRGDARNIRVGCR